LVSLSQARDPEAAGPRLVRGEVTRVEVRRKVLDDSEVDPRVSPRGEAKTQSRIRHHTVVVCRQMSAAGIFEGYSPLAAGERPVERNSARSAAGCAHQPGTHADNDDRGCSFDDHHVGTTLTMARPVPIANA
jgi:hypothetical protein